MFLMVRPGHGCHSAKALWYTDIVSSNGRLGAQPSNQAVTSLGTAKSSERV